MCIAIIVPAGATPPPRSVLEKCFRRNPHGAGFAWATTADDTGAAGTPAGTPVVQYRKGYMDFKSFYEAYAWVPRGASHVIHFRLASSGGSGPAFTHPIPISADLPDLYATEGVTEVGVLIHNGTVPGWGVTSGMSDSQSIARTFGRGVNIVSTELGVSRLALLLPGGLVSLAGAWIPQHYGDPTQPPVQFSNYGFSRPEETLGYKLARWWRGRTADRAARDHVPNTDDRGLVVVDRKGHNHPLHALKKEVGPLGGFYVDPDFRVYLMPYKVDPETGSKMMQGAYRIGKLALHREVIPVKKPKAHPTPI